MLQIFKISNLLVLGENFYPQILLGERPVTLRDFVHGPMFCNYTILFNNAPQMQMSSLINDFNLDRYENISTFSSQVKISLGTKYLWHFSSSPYWISLLLNLIYLKRYLKSPSFVFLLKMLIKINDCH